MSTSAPEEQRSAGNAGALEAAVRASEQMSLGDYKRIRLATGAEATLDDLWYCYRLLLNREPDEAGFATYRDVVQRGAAVEELVSAFLASDEYRARRVAALVGEPAREPHRAAFDRAPKEIR